MADTYTAAIRQAEREAKAILREDAPRTPAEQAAIDALNARRWVLWHADDYSLGVIRLLSCAGLLVDKAHAEEMAKADRVNAELARRDRLADARLISTLDAVIEQVADRLERGGTPAEIAAWLRAARSAAHRARDQSGSALRPLTTEETNR
ncbi:hypothetical protein AB0C10_37820 [Microbispora amethystogenes]|uniref:hypothetical protein n=1 Tax=Microbispora amethystogenes TaxID=1427754 RepID=UPI0033CB1856